MTRTTGLYLILAACLTVSLGAAPSTSPVADAAMRGDREGVRRCSGRAPT